MALCASSRFVNASALMLVLMAMAMSSHIVEARLSPDVKHIMLEAAAPEKAPPMDNLEDQDMSQMTCAQAQAYAAEFHRKFVAAPIDLERVCVSLRTTLAGGMPKCPDFKPTGTFAKLFRVCKVVTNDGALTCGVGSACGTAGAAVSAL